MCLSQFHQGIFGGGRRAVVAGSTRWLSNPTRDAVISSAGFDTLTCDADALIAKPETLSGDADTFTVELDGSGTGADTWSANAATRSKKLLTQCSGADTLSMKRDGCRGSVGGQTGEITPPSVAATT